MDHLSLGHLGEAWEELRHLRTVIESMRDSADHCESGRR
jgi:hypothetical protein